MLLRAAELAIENGFTHYRIVNGSVRGQTQVYTTPGTIDTTANASVYGNSAFGTSFTTYNPPQQHTSTTQHGAMIVQMLSEAAPGALDAKLIYDQLYPKLTKK